MDIITIEELFKDIPPIPEPSINHLKVIDLGADISLVRDRIEDNLILFENPAIMDSFFAYYRRLAEWLIENASKKQHEYKLLIKRQQLKEEERKEYEEILSSLKTMLIAARIYRCWEIRYKPLNKLGLLGNVKIEIPRNESNMNGEGVEKADLDESDKFEIKTFREFVEEDEDNKFLFLEGKLPTFKISDDLRYSNHSIVITYIELAHLIDIEVKEQIQRKQRIIIDLKEIVSKVQNVLNRSIKSKKLIGAVRSTLSLEISQDTEEEKKEVEWRMALGLRQTSVRKVNNYLQYHWEKYDGKDEEYFEFVEDAINQYSQKISYQQQSKAFKWLQKMKDTNTRIQPIEEVSTPLKVPDTPKIPDNKLVFTTDIKHFVYLMQALTKRLAGEKKLLEASDGAIMAFIIRHFCDKDYNSFSVEDLNSYFEKGTKSLNEVLKWNGENVGFGNIWMKFNQLPVKGKSYITSTPEKIAKILAQNFYSNKGDFFTSRTIAQNMKPSVHKSIKERNNFDIEELMNLN